ncbi:hypothetical protein CR513_37816, partial [Mucuna pruriens]
MPIDAPSDHELSLASKNFQEPRRVQETAETNKEESEKMDEIEMDFATSSKELDKSSEICHEHHGVRHRPDIEAGPMSITPYRMDTTVLVELKKKVEELLEKMIRPSVSLWEH